MNVTGPCRMSSGVANPVARSLCVSLQKPIPLPPHNGTPAARIAARAAAAAAAGPGSGGASS